MENRINSNVMSKSLLVWLTIIPLAIINGALRDMVIEPLIGEYAMPISGVILCACIFTVCLLLIPRLGKASIKTYIVIGILWVVMTVAFEFFMGLVIQKVTVDKLITAYDITTGNLWSLVLVFTGFSPWMVAKTRKIV